MPERSVLGSGALEKAPRGEDLEASGTVTLATPWSVEPRRREDEECVFAELGRGVTVRGQCWSQRLRPAERKSPWPRAHSSWRLFGAQMLCRERGGTDPSPPVARPALAGLGSSVKAHVLLARPRAERTVPGSDRRNSGAPGHLDASMAATNLENQLHSAQKNVLFLQREHASTLKGLHAEIRRLQQHCTDLTYELTLKSSEETGDGSGRSSELKRRCEELEAQLQVREQESQELLRELEQKNAMIAVLENTLRERERKYLEELKVKSHKLNMLSGELEQRAGTIAYLTSQLHAAKRKLLGSGGTWDGSPSGSPVLASYKPAPPRDKLPETPRRRMKKSLSAPLHPEFEEAYRFGGESRKLLLREAVDAMPDPTPFLLAREPAEVHLIKERPLVIPPIASDRSSGEQYSPAREKPHKAHVGVAHRIHHVTPPQAQAEAETLAVDQVNGGKAVRKHSAADRTV